MATVSSIQRIVKRNGSVVPYDRDRIVTAIYRATAAVGKGNRSLAASLARQVEERLIQAYRGDMLPSVEDVQDVVEGVLMDHGHSDLARSYIIYRHQRAMLRRGRALTFDIADNIPYRKIYEVLRWNMEQQCESVPALNRLIRKGYFPDLAALCDRRYADEVRRAALQVLERRDDVRVVIVAGPSSSGKTTTTIKLSETLREGGLALKAINIDNYFFDLEMHPVDEFGDYDYETPEALDLELINEHLARLLDGKPVTMPFYDFKTGRRTLNVTPFRLRKREILLIDSLHGLYADMTRSVPEHAKFKLYVETLGQFRGADGQFMRWADNRLLRRMIRDMHFRNLKPIETLTHWHYVRRSELKNIIPFTKHTDYIVNTALPSELPVLKARLFRYISLGRRRYRDDARRLDAYIRANRVYELLKPLKPVRDDTCIARDSLLREFIGGSHYTY
ncbi:MAG: response regulator SirA [Lentisphaerae bacterium]|nr:response regulator SirA [Lentisphaerota bacterium]